MNIRFEGIEIVVSQRPEGFKDRKSLFRNDFHADA
jgi:hypothetical protein